MGLKIVFISDTHNKHEKIQLPEGDVIVHAGDATGRGSMREIQEFIEWYSRLPYKEKILVAGNHDFGFEKTPEVYEEMCRKHGIIYLNDEETVLGGVKFWGSPVSPRFFDWAFNREIDKQDHIDRIYKGLESKMITDHWKLIPSDTDVLITHGPPKGILDETDMGESVGCPHLRDKIDSMNRLKIHVFGHIHEARGVVDHNGTKFINASNLNLRYNPYNEEAYVVEI